MTCPSSCTEPDCTLTYAEHLRGIYVSADATPTRRPGVAYNNRADKKLARDLTAYKSMRQQGIQPGTVDGCDRLSATAKSVHEIEHAG